MGIETKYYKLNFKVVDGYCDVKKTELDQVKDTLKTVAFEHQGVVKKSDLNRLLNTEAKDTYQAYSRKAFCKADQFHTITKEFELEATQHFNNVKKYADASLKALSVVYHGK